MDNPDGTVTRGPGPETASGGAALPRAPRPAPRAPRPALVAVISAAWRRRGPGLVCAGLHGGTVEQLVVRDFARRGDRLGAAARHRADEVGRPCAACPDQRRVPAAE